MKMDLNTQDVLKGLKVHIPTNSDLFILCSLHILIDHWLLTLDGTPQENKKVCTLENEPSLSPSGHSRRSCSSKEPWLRPARSRAKINDKVSWDGLHQSFRAYKKTLHGHLIQVNAGYLVAGDMNSATW